MNYTAILKRAGQITWRYRALWLFGFLLALFSGGGGGNGGGGSSGNIQYNLDRSDLQQLGIPKFPSLEAILPIILAVLALILLLIVISIIVSYTSRGALIGMVDEVERTSQTSIASGFRTGWARFPRLFAISLVIGLPVAVALLLLLALLLALPILLILNAEGLAVLGIIAGILLFFLWLLFAIVTGAAAGLLIEIAHRRCVLAQEGVFSSIREGYLLIRRNLRDAGLTWLILFGISLLFAIVLVPIVLVAIILTIILIVVPAALAWLATHNIVGTILIALPFLLLFIGVITFIEGLYLVFQSAVWTLTYREIVAREQATGL